MNACKIQLAMQTQHVITQKDLICAHVMLVMMVMDSYVMVRKLCHKYNRFKLLAVHINLWLLRLLNLEINECFPISPCHANATCNLTEGSYMCTCEDGYTGNGYTCNGKNALTPSPIAGENIHYAAYTLQYCIV